MELFFCGTMVLMIIAILIVYGLCLGSFVNALVWRLHEQETEHTKKKANPKRLKDLSISRGRSMCPDCSHTLSALDLLPVISWLSLGGKCRYCRKPISWQYPLVELLTASLFVLSYLSWPRELQGLEILSFGLWLVMLVGLMALVVYDLRWMLLPNRLTYPLTALASVFAVLNIYNSDGSVLGGVLQLIAALAVGGGIFYILFQLSGGKWIGGGDVKLGWLLGLIVGTPLLSFLFIFIAALLGTLVAVPAMAAGKLKLSRTIPFGPFLIAGAIVSLLYGQIIVDWYTRLFLPIY